MSKEIMYVEEHAFREGETCSCPYAYTNSQIIMNIAKIFGSSSCVRLYLGGEDASLMCYNTDREWLPFIEVLNRTGIEYEFVLKSTKWFEVDLEELKMKGEI